MAASNFFLSSVATFSEIVNPDVARVDEEDDFFFEDAEEGGYPQSNWFTTARTGMAQQLAGYLRGRPDVGLGMSANRPRMSGAPRIASDSLLFPSLREFLFFFFYFIAC